MKSDRLWITLKSPKVHMVWIANEVRATIAKARTQRQPKARCKLMPLGRKNGQTPSASAIYAAATCTIIAGPALSNGDMAIS